LTTPAPTVVKTITEAEIRDVTHYCHFIGARQGKRSAVNYQSGCNEGLFLVLGKSFCGLIHAKLRFRLCESRRRA